MKGLVSTAASRAWLVVVAVGVVVVVGVIGLGVLPRLTAGQQVLDAAKPAITEQAVKGEVSATKLVARYVDLVDPLVTHRGLAARQASKLVAIVSRKTGGSPQEARALLRREAPHAEALLRAVPLAGIASERPRLTRFLASTLIVTPDALQDELARSFPRLFQMLSDLPSLTGGWYDVPGVDGMTRFDGRTRVRSMHDVRDYLKGDLVHVIAKQRDHVAYLAGWGGIGYIPYLLLIVGAVAIAFGLLQARRAASYPPGRLAWGVVAAIGVAIMLIVGALQYFPRLNGADAMVAKLSPALDSQRVAGLRAGTDLLVQVVGFGDPIATPAGGGAAEYPKLVAFVAERSGLSRSEVRRRLQAAAPRTTALLEAIPLSAVAREVPHLVRVLSRKLGMSRDRLVGMLHARTPAVARAILAVGPVTAGWNAIPGAERLRRFDGVTPARSVPGFADYLDNDLVPVLESQRAHLDDLAGPWPPLSVLPGLVLAIGVLIAIYGVAMMFFATKPPARY